MRDRPGTPVPKYGRAVFLDRDGTITADTHYPHRVEDLAFLPQTLDALAQLARMPVHIIIVTNQAGIALGRYTASEMSAYNAAMIDRVVAAEGRIDAVYYCPHKEPKDLRPGEDPCICAKPAPGMLIEAASDYRFALPASFMVGDKSSDIAAGTAAGATTILLSTGKAGQGEPNIQAKPHFRAEGLFEAVGLVESLIRSPRAVAERSPH